MNILAKKIIVRAYRMLMFPGRSIRAKIAQAPGLRRLRDMKERKLIIFLIPGQEFLCGGTLSIYNLYRFSQELSNVHKAKVIMCAFPGEGGDVCRYTSLDQNVTFYPFWKVLAICHQVEQIQLHVPEYALQLIIERIGFEQLALWRSTLGLRLNILNQNIKLMPPDTFIERLRLVLPEHLTCTTAHPSYSTMEFRQQWQIPLHHLPAWTYPDAALVSGYETKRDLMIVSPDPSPHRQAVLNKIASELPGLEIRIIENMPFEDYLKLARVAKWSLTFGEGMDDYFISVIYRGGISFAVYNQDFFTPEFKSLRVVYPDWETLATRITSDIKTFDSKQAMESYNAEVRPLVTGIWARDKTVAALDAFYRSHFTLP